MFSYNFVQIVQSATYKFIIVLQMLIIAINVNFLRQMKYLYIKMVLRFIWDFIIIIVMIYECYRFSIEYNIPFHFK